MFYKQHNRMILFDFFLKILFNFGVVHNLSLIKRNPLSEEGRGNMSAITRRGFLKKGALTGGATLFFGCEQSQKSKDVSVVSSRRFQWNMVTTWQPHFPVMGEGADKFAEWVAQMSGGRLKITVYGGGELAPALETFDAVSQGIAEMGHGASYYWAGKVPAAQFFAAIPFGMNAQQMNAWLFARDGLALWEELYAPFNLIPIPAGNTGMQMGGWFNREINSIEDFRGLKMRIPGLGGHVIEKAGGAAILSAGGEIYTNLERGVIDATEWIGPYHDYLKGFHRIAKYYYYPGWHELGSVLELIVNKARWESLPPDLQMIVRAAADRANIWMLSQFVSKNNTYLKKLVEEEGVELRPFPKPVIEKLREYSDEVIAEIIGKDAKARKIFESFDKFRRDVKGWAQISEKLYYNM